MTRVSRRKSVKAFAVSLLFFFSSLAVPTVLASANHSAPLAAATPLTALEANWVYTDGNWAAQDYNPQHQINSSNAQNLGVAWLYPIPAQPASLNTPTPGIGVDTTPLIINGTIFLVTQFGDVTALNAATGNVIWDRLLPLRANSTVGMGAGNINLHFHQGEQTYTAGASTIMGGKPTYWISAPDHVIYGIDALTGKLVMNFSYWHGISDVAGNSPTSVYAGLASNIVFDTKRGIMLTGMLSASRSNAARCFVQGWNMQVNPPAKLWTAFCTPPQPNSNVPLDPNWDIEQVNNMTGAQIFYPGPQYNGGGSIPATAVVDLKTLSAAQLNSTLYNDWGYLNQSPFCAAATGGQSTGATGSGWGGSWLVDTKTGIGYVNTGNRGPYTSACNPGPDLWQASVMALNDTNGKWIWAFQTSAHDMWDYDCSWYQGLGNETISGVSTEVLFKTCKNGYLYEINALTGKMIWAWTPPSTILPRCPYCYMQNPLNRTQMTLPWPAPNNQDYIMNPSELAGFESTAAYSPVTNMLYVTSHNVPAKANYQPLNSSNYGQTSGINLPGGFTAYPQNSTIEAVNAATGQTVWTHNIPTQAFRGGMMTSGNVVYAPLVSGDLLLLNAQSGTLIKDIFIGAPMQVVPAIGATTTGQMEVIVPVGVARFFGSGVSVPGDIVALSLQGAGAPSVVTTTSTAVSTTTVGGGATVTTTVGGATITTTVGGGATVTHTTTVGGGGGQTITSVSTVTAPGTTSAPDNTLLYGVGAIAAIFIITTGYLAMRGRKPAT